MLLSQIVYLFVPPPPFFKGVWLCSVAVSTRIFFFHESTEEAAILFLTWLNVSAGEYRSRAAQIVATHNFFVVNGGS